MEKGIMHHKETLLTAARIIDERQQQYGSPDTCFYKAVEIANAVIGGNHKYTERELALILLCVKLARMQENNTLEDNYFDAINYLAFAGQFSIDASDIKSKLPRPKASINLDRLETDITR
jgi:hypothetical protein